MNSSHASTDRRLLELLQASREGDSSSRTELNAWLRSDPVARARLARLLVDEKALINRLRDQEILSLLEAPTLPTLAANLPAVAPARQPVRPQPWWSWAAAALIALGFFGVLFPRFFPTTANAAPEPLPVAVLQDQAEATWQDTQRASGSALPPGHFSLLGGMIALEFNNGARVLIEGPAEFDLLSGDHVHFLSGRISAEVPPPARGFVVSTPTMRVVDLGTRFGLSLSAEGTGVVRVDKGEIEVHRNQAQRNLRDGEAIAFDAKGEIDPALFPDSLLPTETDLRGRLAFADTLRQRRWRTAFDKLRRDTAAILACPFTPQEPTDRTAANEADARNPENAIALVGAAWAEGRWPGKSAVEFRGRGDRVRLQVPGTHPQLTLLCWVRVDSLSNDYNGLLIPNEYPAGAIQWMLRRDGHLRFSMVNGLASPATLEGWDRVITAPALSNSDLGRWVLLCTSYDSATGEVRHYRDGVLIGEGKLGRPLPAVLGSMGVGNWAGGSAPTQPDSPKRPNTSLRNLVGRLDELTVLSRVVGPEEIRDYYESGRP